jgi:predicted RNase H-like HicB family nuclease
MTRRTIQARIFRDETKYAADCIDLSVVTEGDTLDEAAANLREAIALHLEGEDIEREDIAELGFVDDPAIIAYDGARCRGVMPKVGLLRSTRGRSGQSSGRLSATFRNLNLTRISSRNNAALGIIFVDDPGRIATHVRPAPPAS